MALSKIDVANMLTGATPVANGGTALTSGFVNGKDPRVNVKPIIINGNMAVSQRTTSTTGVTSTTYGACDRMQLVNNTMGTYTVIQESLTSGAAYEAGFHNAWRIDCTTADSSPASGDVLYPRYKIESQDLSVFKKGTSGAEAFTIAFWVKSNKTGNAQVNFYDIDNTRWCSGTYSISSADTWEHKVINIAADTTGAWADDNGEGLRIEWRLDSGSDSTSGATPTAWEAHNAADRDVAGQLQIARSTDNDWAITGIQLEVGTFTSATLPPFQFETFKENLARCQRYFTMIADGRLGGGSNEAIIGAGYCHSGNINYFADGILPVKLRTYDPSIFTVTGTNNYKALRDNGEDYFDSLVMYSQYNAQGFSVNGTGNVSATQGHGVQMRLGSSSTYLGVDSEL